MQVPVYAVGVGGDAYQGFNLHLRWDPAVFSFSSASAAGGVFDPTASPSTGFCVSPNTSVYDSDGGGVVLGCAGYSATNASGKLLATFTLTPAASGCSKIHLYTFGSPDGGDASSGTFTVNAADDTAQANVYYDGAANTLGQGCVPPALPTTSSRTRLAPATASPTGGNCTYDVTGNGVINIFDLSGVAGHYGQTPASPGWDSRYDVDANDVINIFDLSRTASEYGWTTVGCVPEYPYYLPDTWDGSIPGNAYQFQDYYLNTGAMKYVGGPCPWVFDTIVGAGTLNTCTAATDLKFLAGHLHADHPMLWSQVFIGPNDCTAPEHMGFDPNATILNAAGALVSMIDAANQYSLQQGDLVVFSAAVDDEAYTWAWDTNHSPPRFDCGVANRSLQFPNTDALFSDYRYLATAFNAVSKFIGPAGAPPYQFSDQETLAEHGGGPAIPQIYNTTNPVVTKGTNGAQIGGAWPIAIANGYLGIQSYPGGDPSFIGSWEANIRWGLNHLSPPGSNFDWSCPGARC